MKFLSFPINILRDGKQFFDDIRKGRNLKDKVLALLGAVTSFFALYGIVIGSFSGLDQALASGLKLPVLYLLTMLICLPTLYVFNMMFGARHSIGQYVALLLSSLGVMSILLLAFAPITILFMTTSNHYQFYKILNVLFFATSGLIGLRYFYRGMQFLSGDDALPKIAKQPKPGLLDSDFRVDELPQASREEHALETEEAAYGGSNSARFQGNYRNGVNPPQDSSAPWADEDEDEESGEADSYIEAGSPADTDSVQRQRALQRRRSEDNRSVQPSDTGRTGSAAIQEYPHLRLGKFDAVKTRKRILVGWMGLFGFVGCQLGWILRPFFGAPGEAFEIFRVLDGNFYTNIVESIASIFGFK